MLDFGIITEEKTEDYKTKFLNELTPEEEITGEVVVGEFKSMPMGNREVAEFYIIITDHENQMKWVCEITAPYFPETDNVYGEKGGVFYSFIDSLNHVVNGTPSNWQCNYSVKFYQFRKTVNENISQVTLKAVPPILPDAKSVNLEITSAKYKTEKKKEPVTIYDLAEQDPIILMGYARLRNKGDRITVKNITFELKSLLDDGKITPDAYKQVIKNLKEVKD